MKQPSRPYISVNCAFHDYLEHFATLRQIVVIVYRDESTGQVKTIKEGVITDLSGGRNGEYSHIKFPGGKKIIRNDYLISVSDINVSDFEGDNCGV